MESNEEPKDIKRAKNLAFSAIEETAYLAKENNVFFHFQPSMFEAMATLNLGVTFARGLQEMYITGVDYAESVMKAKAKLVCDYIEASIANGGNGEITEEIMQEITDEERRMHDLFRMEIYGNVMSDTNYTDNPDHKRLVLTLMENCAGIAADYTSALYNEIYNGHID